jgi:RNA polymerase sigma-70 factor (ECF subfamily)
MTGQGGPPTPRVGDHERGTGVLSVERSPQTVSGARLERPLQALSDEELVPYCLSLATGDGAFSEIFRRHYGLVWRVCRRYVRNDEAARDLAQDSFFRAFRAIARFESTRESSLRSWLAQIAANTSKNELRRRSRRPRIADEPVDQDLAADPLDISAVLDEQEAAAALHRALARLPARHREALQLADLDELPYGEIAQRLEISLSGVKMRVVRARTALAQEMRKE